MYRLKVTLYFEKYLFPVKKIHNASFQCKYNERPDDFCRYMRKVHKAKQTTVDEKNISGKPIVTHDFEKQVNEDGIHSEYRKEQKMALVLFNINPPVADCQEQYAITSGRKYKSAGGYSLDDRGNASPVQSESQQ